jgi:hypothetical protein
MNRALLPDQKTLVSLIKQKYLRTDTLNMSNIKRGTDLYQETGMTVRVFLDSYGILKIFRLCSKRNTLCGHQQR